MGLQIPNIVIPENQWIDIRTISGLESGELYLEVIGANECRMISWPTQPLLDNSNTEMEWCQTGYDIIRRGEPRVTDEDPNLWCHGGINGVILRASVRF